MNDVRVAAALVMMVFSGTAIAGDLWIRSDTYSQIRLNTLDERNWPTVEYFAAQTSLGKGQTFDFSLQAMGDPLAERSHFELYSAKYVFHLPGRLMEISLGRQQLLHTFSYDLLDGASVTFRPDFPIGVETYGGWRRFIELDDFETWNFATGARLFLQNVRRARLSTEIRYERTDTDTAWTEAGVMASYDLPAGWRPVVKAGLNQDVSNGVTREGSLGLGLRPHRRFGIDLAAGRYDFEERSDDPRDGILRIFALGPQWNYREGVGLDITRFLSLFQSYTLHQYDHSLVDSDTGHSFEAGAEAHFPEPKMTFRSSYFLEESYGGRAYGVRNSASATLSREFSVGARVNVMHFSKVTGNSGNATAVSANLTYLVARGLKASAGGELISNNEFSRDLRANVSLRYEYL